MTKDIYLTELPDGYTDMVGRKYEILIFVKREDGSCLMRVEDVTDRVAGFEAEPVNISFSELLGRPLPVPEEWRNDLPALVRIYGNEEKVESAYHEWCHRVGVEREERVCGEIALPNQVIQVVSEQSKETPADAWEGFKRATIEGRIT